MAGSGDDKKKTTSAAPSGSSGKIYGTASGGGSYVIGSQKGQDFVNSAAAGSTMTGGDGSTWTKNADGTTTIVSNGVSYNVGKPAGGTSPGGSTPSGKGNSASGVGVSSDSQQSIKDQMNQNSNAWWTADEEGRKQLEEANRQLAAQLGGTVAFDPVTGTWSGDAMPEFSYENAPEYVSQWGDIIRDLADQILNREPFSYDYTEDPGYQQYKQAYTREGQRAMQDTIGQAAAMTGGMASSYATTAGSQANNYYMAQLADKIPELRQLAYEAYLANIGLQRDDLSMLMGLEDADYNRYLNSLNQWNTDRTFNYGVYRDQISDQRYEDEWEYTLEQDQWNKDLQAAGLLASIGDFSGYAALFGLSENQTQALVDDYARQQNTTKEQAARELADWYAQYGDFSKLRELGVDTSYLQFMQNQDYMSAYRGGSSGGSGSGSGESGADAVENIYEMLYSAGVRTEGDAYAYLMNMGYNTTQTGKLAGYYMEWLDAREDGEAEDEESDGDEPENSAWYDGIFDWAAGAAAAIKSDSGLPQLQQELERIQASGNPSSVPRRAASAIQSYYERGSITEATAARLLAQYGYSV